MLSPSEIKKRAIEFSREHPGDADEKSRSKDLDAAVDKCYRKEPLRSELERVKFLLGLYDKYTASLTARAEGWKR